MCDNYNIVNNDVIGSETKIENCVASQVGRRIETSFLI